MCIGAYNKADLEIENLAFIDMTRNFSTPKIAITGETLKSYLQHKDNGKSYQLSKYNFRTLEVESLSFEELSTPRFRYIGLLVVVSRALV